MEGLPFLLGEVVTLIVGNEVDDGPFGQRRWLVQISRHFSSRARKGPMRLLYGFRVDAASDQAARRRSSISLTHRTIWFQLAGIGDAIPARPTWVRPPRHQPIRRRMTINAKTAEKMVRLKPDTTRELAVLLP